MLQDITNTFWILKKPAKSLTQQANLVVAEVRYCFYPPMRHRWCRLGLTGRHSHHNARCTIDLCGRSTGSSWTMRNQPSAQQGLCYFISADSDFSILGNLSGLVLIG